MENIVIDDKFVKEVQARRRSLGGNSFLRAIQRQIDRHRDPEEMILFGQRPGGGIHETVIGTMFGIAPGVILLENEHRPEIAGLVVKPRNLVYGIFQVIPLYENPSNTGLAFSVTRMYFSHPLAQECFGFPAGVKFVKLTQQGAGTILIDKARWSAMVDWFEKYLEEQA